MYLFDTYPYPVLYFILYHPVTLSVPTICTVAPCDIFPSDAYLVDGPFLTFNELVVLPAYPKNY